MSGARVKRELLNAESELFEALGDQPLIRAGFCRAGRADAAESRHEAEADALLGSVEAGLRSGRMHPSEAVARIKRARAEYRLADEYDHLECAEWRECARLVAASAEWLRKLCGRVDRWLQVVCKVLPGRAAKEAA